MALGVNKADKGHNRYCGPGALSILTGIDTAQAARLLRHISQRKYIKGTSNWVMLRALNALGYSTQSVYLRPNVTLAQWLRESRNTGAYLVNITDHYCVITDRMYVDNVTGQGVALSRAPHRRARVVHAWHVTRTRTVSPASVIPAEPERKPNPEAGARAKVMKLAKLHNICVERHTDLDSRPLWVGPMEETDDDPCEGDHYVHEWSEALQRVQSYIEHAARKAAEAAKPKTLADAVRAHLPGRITQLAYRVGCKRMQVRGAALTLIRRGEARYFRGRLVAVTMGKK